MRLRIFTALLLLVPLLDSAQPAAGPGMFMDDPPQAVYVAPSATTLGDGMKDEYQQFKAALSSGNSFGDCKEEKDAFAAVKAHANIRNSVKYIYYLKYCFESIVETTRNKHTLFELAQRIEASLYGLHCGGVSRTEVANQHEREAMLESAVAAGQGYAIAPSDAINLEKVAGQAANQNIKSHINFINSAIRRSAIVTKVRLGMNLVIDGKPFQAVDDRILGHINETVPCLGISGLRPADEQFFNLDVDNLRRILQEQPIGEDGEKKDEEVAAAAAAGPHSPVFLGMLKNAEQTKMNFKVSGEITTNECIHLFHVLSQNRHVSSIDVSSVTINDFNPKLPLKEMAPTTEAVWKPCKIKLGILDVPKSVWLLIEDAIRNCTGYFGFSWGDFPYKSEHYGDRPKWWSAITQSMQAQ